MKYSTRICFYKQPVYKQPVLLGRRDEIWSNFQYLDNRMTSVCKQMYNVKFHLKSRTIHFQDVSFIMIPVYVEPNLLKLAP